MCPRFSGAEACSGVGRDACRQLCFSPRLLSTRFRAGAVGRNTGQEWCCPACAPKTSSCLPPRVSTSKPTASSRQNRFIAVCDLHLPAFLNTLWGPTALAFLFGSCLFHPIPNITNGVACPPRLLMHGKLLGVIVRAVHLLEISLENSF